MSATGRAKKNGAPTKRDVDDNYETPAWCVEAIWPHIRPIQGNVLDPTCGRGAIFEALAGKVEKHRLFGVELDIGRAAEAKYRAHVVRCDNFLEPTEDTKMALWGWKPSLIIDNPPYGIALEVIQTALALAKPHGGEVAMLLRVNFLGGQARGPWLVDHKPDIWVLSERPSYTRALRWDPETQQRCPMRLPTDDLKKKGARCQRPIAHEDECATYGTDATEYAWFVWGPYRKGMLHILPPAAYGRTDWKPRKTVDLVEASP